MNNEKALRRAQIYGFLSHAFLYPEENWIDDLPALLEVLHALDVGAGLVEASAQLFLDQYVVLADLQIAHLHTFGVAGSLWYETECGLPHEFRQSQELADIAGFYRAFGFTVGGPVCERPDHLAVELEFMYVLALKEAYAIHHRAAEHIDVCTDAQRKFLEDHLGRWIGLFAENLVRLAPDSLYTRLACFAVAFITTEAQNLGVQIERQSLAGVRPTPFGPELSCESCPIAETLA